MSKMSKNKRVDAGDAVQLIANQGREILKEGNRRRIIARSPDNKIVLDLSVTQAVVASLLVVMFLPLGWLILAGVAAFGISKKVRVDFVRELGEGDDNAMIASTKRKTDRLSTHDSPSNEVDGDTIIEDESAKSKRG